MCVLKEFASFVKSHCSRLVKTFKWEVHHFYLDQNFVKPTLRLQIEKYFNGVYEVIFFDLKPKSWLYEFLVQIKVMDFSFDCLYCVGKLMKKVKRKYPINIKLFFNYDFFLDCSKNSTSVLLRTIWKACNVNYQTLVVS